MAVSFSVIAFPALLLGAKVQILFLISWFITVVILMRCGYPFERLQQGAAKACQKAFSPVFFLLCAGAMIGAWNFSGTLPSLAILGMTFINVRVFLLMAFSGCLVFGLVTGTVFGTLGTAGLMFLVVGKSMGVPAELVTAAVVSGGLLGYGISPLADCTNLVSSSAGATLAETIRSERKLVFPMIGVCAVFFGAAGFLTAGDFHASGEWTVLSEEIQSTFKTGAVPFIPVILVVGMLLARIPAIMTIAAGTFSAVLTAVLYQGADLPSALAVLWNGPVYADETGHMMQYFGGGGIKSMSDTVLLFILAFGLFGVLEECRIIQMFIRPFILKTDSRLKATCVTVCLGFILNVISASAMCSFIFTLSCLNPVYEEKGWSKGDLCCASFAGCLYMSLFIPWHSNVVTPAALLGMPGEFIQGKGLIPFMAAVLIFVFQGFSLDRKLRAAAAFLQGRKIGSHALHSQNLEEK